MAYCILEGGGALEEVAEGSQEREVRGKGEAMMEAVVDKALMGPGSD